MRRLFLLCVIACTRKATTVDASTTTTSVATPSASATASSAPIVDAAPIEASVDAGIRVIDAPQWPTPATDLKLTWAVYPSVENKRTGEASSKVELVLRMGAVARRIDLDRQTGRSFRTTRASVTRRRIRWRRTRSRRSPSTWVERAATW